MHKKNPFLFIQLFNFILKRKFFLLTLFSAILFFGFGAKNIGQFATADEHYWLYERIPQYWNAWQEGKYKKTLINDKPGVTTTFFSGIGLFFEPHPEQHDLSDSDDISLRPFDTSRTEPLYATYRYPILAVNSIMLLFLFWNITKIASQKVAFWSVFFMACSPMLLGMSRIINPDSLLWSFGSAAFFSYIALLKSEEKKFILFTALFTGLAILSKYTANILFPLYVLLFVFYSLFWHKSKHPKKRAYFIIQNTLFLALISIGSFVPVALLLPAIFIKPIYAYRLTLGLPHMTTVTIASAALLALLALDAWCMKCRVSLCAIKVKYLKKFSTSMFPIFLLVIFFTLLIGRVTFDWNLFKDIPFDIKNISDIHQPINIIETLFVEFNPIIFSLTPVTLIFVIFAWCLYTFKIKKRDYSETTFLIFSASAFIVLYVLANIASGVVLTPRYSIMLYPIFAFLAAIGLSKITERDVVLSHYLHRVAKLPQKYSQATHTITHKAIPVLIVIFSLASQLLSSPFFHNYTNLFLPKDTLISDTWGASGYFAAQYLNSLQDAENITVWSDYFGVCEFFKGKCTTKYTLKPNQYIDYFVLTRRGHIRYTDMHIKWERENGVYADRYYEESDSEWALYPDKRKENFIRIVKADQTLRASIITDIDHCPSRSAVSKENLFQFLNESKNSHSSFIVSLGDNASHRLRDCSVTADMDAREIAEYIRSYKLPSHFVLGDHDIASSDISYKNWIETIKRDRPFYSFETPLAHVIVLDTVMGGEPLVKECADHPFCREAEQTHKLYENTAKNSVDMQKFLDSHSITRKEFFNQRLAAKMLLKKELDQIRYTRNATHRDRGMVLEREIEWLKQDISHSQQNKVLLLSDHPLFPFTSERKSYDIVNGKTVRDILESSGKKVVAISGEAHVWHETELNGIHYYIVDEFRKSGGSWATFLWDENGYRLEKTIRNPLEMSPKDAIVE